MDSKRYVKYVGIVTGIIIVLLAGIFMTHKLVNKNADIQDNSEETNNGYQGYIILTDSDVFFAAENDSKMLSEKELVKLNLENCAFVSDDFSTGDRVRINFVTIADLSPRIADVDSIEKIEAGDVSNIDEEVIGWLKEKEYKIY